MYEFKSSVMVIRWWCCVYVKILGVIEEKTRTKMIVWKTLWKKKKVAQMWNGKTKKGFSTANGDDEGRIDHDGTKDEQLSLTTHHLTIKIHPFTLQSTLVQHTFALRLCHETPQPPNHEAMCATCCHLYTLAASPLPYIVSIVTNTLGMNTTTTNTIFITIRLE